MLNGLHASASIVATLISARAIHPRLALILAALGVAIGPFVFGMAVANTIASELVTPEAVTIQVVAAALVGAIIWSLITLWFRIPVSISQALLGGLFGAAWVASGPAALQINGLLKILAALILSPLLGLIAGYILVRFIYSASFAASPRIQRWYNRGQIPVAMLLAAAFGTNDGQKIVGALVLGLLATGQLQQFAVPQWVIVVSAGGIAFGTLVGGWRLIHTLGNRFYKIRPVHGLGAQLAAAAVLSGAGVLGGPVSGSQVVTASILGAGSADHVRKVRWGMAGRFLIAWVATVPFAALCAALAYEVLS